MQVSHENKGFTDAICAEQNSTVIIHGHVKVNYGLTHATANGAFAGISVWAIRDSKTSVNYRHRQVHYVPYFVVVLAETDSESLGGVLSFSCLTPRVYLSVS